MLYWLVLVLSGGVNAVSPGATPNYPQALHVGNFPTMEACETAAKEAKFVPVRANGLVVVSGFVCVRSQGQGVPAPQ